MKNRELTRLLQAHPEEGLEAAMLEYAPLVKGILCRILPQNPCDREECMADVFVALWRNAAKLETTLTPLRPWLAVAARRASWPSLTARPPKPPTSSVRWWRL